MCPLSAHSLPRTHVQDNAPRQPLEGRVKSSRQTPDCMAVLLGAACALITKRLRSSCSTKAAPRPTASGSSDDDRSSRRPLSSPVPTCMSSSVSFTTKEGLSCICAFAGPGTRTGVSTGEHVSKCRGRRVGTRKGGRVFHGSSTGSFTRVHSDIQTKQALLPIDEGSCGRIGRSYEHFSGAAKPERV